MSVVQSAMFRDQFSTFSSGSRHNRTPSYTDLKKRLSDSAASMQLKTLPTDSLSPPGLSLSYVKKRSHSDLEGTQTLHYSAAKRSKTAPPSPPSSHEQSFDLSHAQVLDSDKSALSDKPNTSRVTLPSISDALGPLSQPDSIQQQQSTPQMHRTIPPTVSLDYFDTYKPKDENWRFNVLDTIKHSTPSVDSNPTTIPKRPDLRSNSSSTSEAVGSPLFSSSIKSYPAKAETPKVKLPSISELSNGTLKPTFDTRVSSKALPKPSERKINFPYESNYTYLNKTYMNDIERYPEYLELAQSLIQLSRASQQHYNTPQATSRLQPLLYTAFNENTSSSQQYANSPTQRNYDSEKERGHSGSSAVSTGAYTGDANKTLVGHYHTMETPQSSSTQFSFVTPKSSFSETITKAPSAPQSPTTKREKEKSSSQQQRTKFIPITPPSVKDKTRSELMKSPPRHSQAASRVCISCGSDQSPCWRPSWSIKEGQLCNSCGLRYKKTSARCLNNECKKIPAKGEWSLMQTKGKVDFPDGERCYGCLECGSKVEVKR